ncbi:metalloregulator ArsR/SmtB family transcription factor [Rahnella sp. C60]|jgi:ArsR family transcriptional regulator, arsenate/arsenite/antimonite-responsive transcriptional repressor|uniref:Metalloregulator ArsR/SmtB family transcription factor n=1 Tax=Rahnella perminowiae TaxID=2816244 RepID=A0ABS6L8C5_9GAMM|nr:MULTISPECIES: metalloregulator ArsR/SmtB family transcription factor [Rahnella]MBU9808769.1 metalloregulator ArsR/SmtB family transcription factor [Rahnella perminowiae]MBU9813502.1 metalloregulator ArsR/SmtB family transcription factor [Rahnella perminowiae]MBU9825054.1 metalloregulator ArsR/SmtB family transcription factor [Rahnella perminowiae]MBU9838100.1 metalloregulator ArsR/SmtB family transcription factor [Rahnella perminowiae]MCR9000092.1 metalloregulator ArsR/SmtB family transcrip
MNGLSSLVLFKNLSDETRLSIVMLLREAGELCVCEIIGVLNESQPKISRHLAMLRETGLILDRRDGKWIHYRLSPHMPAWAAAVIEQAFLSDRDKITAQVKNITRNQNTTGGKSVCL